MAEVKQKEAQPQNGARKRAKKLSLSIDMTPMVDLAFLLLTFFMLASSFLKPHAMELVMPERTGTTKPVNEAVTLLISPGNELHYYYGLKKAEAGTLSYSAKGLRQFLYNYATEHPKGTVIVKADENARYSQVVTVLDELNITGIQRFALVDITDEELEITKKK